MCGEGSPCLYLLRENQNFPHREELPYSRAGLLMEKSSGYVKINIRLVLTFLWNEEDSALVRTLTQFPTAPYNPTQVLNKPLPSHIAPLSTTDSQSPPWSPTTLHFPLESPQSS